MNSSSKKYIVLPNGKVELDYVIELREHKWELKKYISPDALKDKNGGTAWLYVGQKFDPTKVDLIKGGWNHDHCEICHTTIAEGETEIEFENEGFYSEYEWICKNCHSNFIKPTDLESVLSEFEIIEK